MKNVLKIFGLSILVSIIGVGISKISYINLIWVFTIAFFLTGNTRFAVSFSVVGGFMYDLFLHNNVGVTSLAILLGILIYLGIRSLFSGDGLIYQIMSVIFSVFFSFVIKASVEMLTESIRYESISDFFYWITDFIVHSIAVGVIIWILGGIRGAVNQNKKIRLK